MLAKAETLTLSKDLFADFVPGTGRAGLSVAVSTSLDAATLLNALDRYPFGCSEQIASRAMPFCGGGRTQRACLRATRRIDPVTLFAQPAV